MIFIIWALPNNEKWKNTHRSPGITRTKYKSKKKTKSKTNELKPGIIITWIAVKDTLIECGTGSRLEIVSKTEPDLWRSMIAFQRSWLKFDFLWCHLKKRPQNTSTGVSPVNLVLWINQSEAYKSLKSSFGLSNLSKKKNSII